MRAFSPATWKLERLVDFINATVGFTKLSDLTHRSAKSRCDVCDRVATPARNLFEIAAYLQEAEGERFEVPADTRIASLPSVAHLAKTNRLP